MFSFGELISIEGLNRWFNRFEAESLFELFD